RELNDVLEESVILRTLVAAARRLASARGGAAGLVRDGNMVFAEYDDAGTLRPIDLVFRPGDPRGIASWVLRERTHYVSNDAAHDPVIRPDLRQIYGIKTAVCLPVFDRGGGLIACFLMYNKEGGRPFDGDDLRALQGLAASAAIALENARLLERVRETDRRKD